MFYEDMFTTKGLGQLCAFLDITPAAADFDRRIHSGPEHPATPEEVTLMRDWLAPQYEFVARDMGSLPAAWAPQTTPPGGRNILMKV